MKLLTFTEICSLFKNSIRAILQGRFLLRLKADRFFIHIVFTFFLFAMAIWFSLTIETSMAEVEKNKAVLKELEIQYSQKTFELVKLSRRSEVERELKKLESEVGEPQKPATVLK